MPNLKISMVTCSYQQGKYLDATIRSILDQQYPNLEYFVVDGGSRDQSVEVIQRHQDKLTAWVSEKDRGQTHALAKGFAQAKGDILGWLCSDDILLPGALQKVAAYFEAHPEVDFIYGNALWIDAQGGYIRPKKEMPWNRFIFMFDHNYLAQPSCFWRRSLFEKVGGLDESWNLGMDSDLWMRFSHHTRPHYINEYLGCMRDYPEQKTQALRPAGQLETLKLRRREMPLASRFPARPLSLLARVGRIVLKGMLGGYTAKPPEALVKALDRYRIN